MTESFLPTLNALLNATSFCLLVGGFLAIKRRAIDVHRRFMLAASTVSALFFVSYVTYHAQSGSRPFAGEGWIRAVYFIILVPHVLLAAALVPLAIVTLRRGLGRRDQDHRHLARVTFPIWIFVSVTGVVVYLMLYQL